MATFSFLGVSSCIFLIGSLTFQCKAAQWTDVGEMYKNIYSKRESSTLEDTVDQMERDSGDTFVGGSEMTTEDGLLVKKYTQEYCGVPIYNSQMTVEADNENHATKGASGKILSHINKDYTCDDINNTISQSKAEEVVEKELKKQNSEYSQGVFEFSSTKVIGIADDTSEGSPKVTVMFLIDVQVSMKDGSSDGFTFKIDAFTSKVIDYWKDGESNTIGVDAPGGNTRTPVCYNKNGLGQLIVPKLNTKVDGFDCVLGYNQFYVINHPKNKLYYFHCNEWPKDPVNEGRSPLSDVFFYTYKIHFLWFKHMGRPIFNKDANIPVKMNVHYTTDCNAFYRRHTKEVYFGDCTKDGVGFPFTTVDIVGHEIAHRISHLNSGLEYRGVSGGLNEAYSDLHGKAAEQYVLGKHDFYIGGTVLKKEGFYLRDMCQQSKDGTSVIHTKDFYESIDPHYSSGIFNRISCLLIKSDAYDIYKVFKLYSWANILHWPSTLSFEVFACKTKLTAEQLQYDVGVLNNAFKEVGIPICTS